MPLTLTPERDGRIDPLLEPGSDGRLGVARVDGPVRGELGVGVAWVLVEGGLGGFTVGDEGTHVEGRDDVFESAGWSAIVGRDTEFALHGDLRATIVWRREVREIPSRLIPPDAVSDEERGEGATFRRVRTYVDTGPLIVGETLNPPGLWSSYPPHRHEHEEIYLYRFDPPDGFGLQMRSESDDDERAVVVRDGRIERITSGWHARRRRAGLEPLLPVGPRRRRHPHPRARPPLHVIPRISGGRVPDPECGAPSGGSDLPGGDGVEP